MKTTTAFAVASSLSGIASALPYMGPGTLEMRQQMTSKNATWTDLRGKVSLPHG
jgi:phospholipase C